MTIQVECKKNRTIISEGQFEANFRHDEWLLQFNVMLLDEHNARDYANFVNRAADILEYQKLGIPIGRKGE